MNFSLSQPRVVHPLFRLVLVALSLSGPGFGCVKQVKKPASPGWEQVVGSLDLVASDPLHDAIHVRTPFGAVSFAHPDLKTRSIDVPSLRAAPAHAQATVTQYRALRWFDEQGKWDDQDDGSKTPPLGEAGVLAGVLFSTPLEGPGVGRPQPLCLISREIPDGSVIARRGDTALSVHRGRARLINLKNCQTRTLDLGARRILSVLPAASPDGDYWALAAEDELNLSRVDPDAPPPPPFRVLLIRGDNGSLLDALPLGERPLALHLAGGSVFVQLGEDFGQSRRLLRHPHRVLDHLPDESTLPEAELAELRRELLEQMWENHEAQRVASALDRLWVLERSGFLDAPTDSERRMVEQVRRGARIRLDTEIDRAMNEADLAFAALVDRRAAQLDGRRRMPGDAGVPRLAVNITASPDVGLTLATVRSQLRASWWELVDECGSLNAAGTPCLDIDLQTRELERREIEQRRNQALRRLQSVSAALIGRRESCPSKGPWLVELAAIGPVLARACDHDIEAWRSLRVLDEIWEELLRLEQGSEFSLWVRLVDGSEKEVLLPARSKEKPEELLERAIDLALSFQGELDLARRTKNERTADWARTFLWRSGGGGSELLRVLAGDGSVRPGI